MPVIAPPVDHTALLPQSTELLAKARISAFIYREKALRLRDRLFPETLILSPTTQDNFLGSVACSSDRKKSFDDNFSNTSDESDEDNEDEASIDSQLDDRYHDEGKDPDSLRYSDTWEAILNIGQHEREQVVRWLLEVFHSSFFISMFVKYIVRLFLFTHASTPSRLPPIRLLALLFSQNKSRMFRI